MYLILFLVGVVLAFAGALLVHSSVPVEDIPRAALFNSGIIAIVGGLILMALAVVVLCFAPDIAMWLPDKIIAQVH